MLQPAGSTHDNNGDNMNTDRKLLNNFLVSWILSVMTMLVIVCYWTTSVFILSLSLMTVFVTLSSWTASPLFGIDISDDSIYRGLLFTENSFCGFPSVMTVIGITRCFMTLWTLITNDINSNYSFMNKLHFNWILISDDSDRDHKMLNDFVDSHH